MSLTFKDVKYQLSMLDEVLVLEVLDINSTELVERFEDKIEDKLDQIVEGLGGDTDELS
jgi:hypothetical protein|tara:strand:+ start:375 stop:551 length:177 start_codon:yes stop_codon:yes gene_type:complete